MIRSQNYFVDVLEVQSTFLRLAYPTDTCVRINNQNQAMSLYGYYECLSNGNINKTIYNDELCTQMVNGSEPIIFNETASFGELYRYNCSSDILSYVVMERFGDVSCAFSNGEQYIATDICYENSGVYSKATCSDNMGQLISYSDPECLTITSTIDATPTCTGIDQGLPFFTEYIQVKLYTFNSNIYCL